jgi:hypothetical protein
VAKVSNKSKAKPMANKMNTPMPMIQRVVCDGCEPMAI